MEPGMLNENPNDFHWRNKLDDAEALSGETLADKNAAWEKLHNRLSQQPRRIRVVWYWAAAACLLLAVVIPFIAVNKKQDVLVKNNVAETQPANTTPAQILPLKENETATISAAAATEKKNALKQPAKTIKAGDIIIDIAKKEEQPAPDLIEQQIMVHQQISAAVPVVDTTLSTRATPVIIAKIFKVVHINEMGDPVEVTTDMARNADLHAFQLKLATQEVYKNPAVALNKSILTGSKPKTSPN